MRDVRGLRLKRPVGSWSPPFFTYSLAHLSLLGGEKGREAKNMSIARAALYSGRGQLEIERNLSKGDADRTGLKNYVGVCN